MHAMQLDRIKHHPHLYPFSISLYNGGEAGAQPTTLSRSMRRLWRRRRGLTRVRVRSHRLRRCERRSAALQRWHRFCWFDGRRCLSISRSWQFLGRIGFWPARSENRNRRSAWSRSCYASLVGL